MTMYFWSSWRDLINVKKIHYFKHEIGEYRNLKDSERKMELKIWLVELLI